MHAVVLAVLSFCQPADAPAPDESVVVESPDVTGEWVVTEVVESGKVVPRAYSYIRSLAFRKGTVEGASPGWSWEVVYSKLDFGSNPPRFEFWHMNLHDPEPKAGLGEYGIIRVRGDVMTLAFGGDGRPKAFVSEPGSGVTLLTLRRERK